MCMCCEIPIYVNKIMGTENVLQGLKTMCISLIIMTIVEAALTIAGISAGFSEDILTDILYYMSIVVCIYATIWVYIVYKKPTSDLLLVSEYAVLMVPLPCFSLFGYTLLTQSIFCYIDHVFQVGFAVMNLYFAVCLHSVYIEQIVKEQEENEAAA